MDGVLVKAYTGAGNFSLWANVVKFAKVHENEARSIIEQGPIEAYVFSRDEAQEPHRHYILYFNKASGREEYQHQVIIQTQFSVYLMNETGKTIEGFN